MTSFFFLRCCSYWFQTPEGWTTDGHYRSLVYMRPLAIWAIQYALSPPKAILEAPKVNLMDRIHISPHMARAISEISIRKIAPDNRCFPSSAFQCECWYKGNMQLATFSSFRFLLCPPSKVQWRFRSFLEFEGISKAPQKLSGAEELYNCTETVNRIIFLFTLKTCRCYKYLSCLCSVAVLGKHCAYREVCLCLLNGARSTWTEELGNSLYCKFVIMWRYEEVSVLADVIHVYWKKLMPQWRKGELSIAACITGVWLESMKSCWDPETTHLFTIGSSFFIWKGLLLFLVQSSYWTEHTPSTPKKPDV